jgi:flagellar hook-length control protein FliK
MKLPSELSLAANVKLNASLDSRESRKTGLAADAFAQVFVSLEKSKDARPAQNDEAPKAERETPRADKKTAGRVDRHKEARKAEEAEDARDDRRADKTDADSDQDEKTVRTDDTDADKVARKEDDTPSRDAHACQEDKEAVKKDPVTAGKTVEASTETSASFDLQLVDETVDTAELAANASVLLQVPVEVKVETGKGVKQPNGEETAEKNPDKQTVLETLLSFRTDLASGASEKHAGQPATDEGGVHADAAVKTGIDASLLAQLGLKAEAKAAVNAEAAAAKADGADAKANEKLLLKLAGDGTAGAGDDSTGKDAFSALVQTNLEATKTMRDSARDHHDAKLALLKGQDTSEAPPSFPAAGSRVMASAPEKAVVSSIPAPNTVAGGGPPLKNDAALSVHGMAGIENVKAGSHDVSFAGMVKAGKDGLPASTMQAPEQVAVHVYRMAKSGENRFDLQLHPAELGRVDIRLEIGKEGLVRAAITADNVQALDALQKDGRMLERALEQAGLQTDSGSLSFNLRGENQAGSQQAAQDQGKHSSGTRWSNDNRVAVEEEVKLVAQYTVAAGRVDVRV